MNKKENKFLNHLSKSFKTAFWIMCFALAIEAFTLKSPNYVLVGIFLLLIGFLQFPLTTYILKKINVVLTGKQKWFIGIICLFIASYLNVKVTKSYTNCIIASTLMIFVWIIVIIYSKYKSKHIKKRF